MKKLLGLLAATGLVASASISVVACGKKPGVSTDDSILATKLLIDEFINDIGYTMYSHIESEPIHNNLTREIKPDSVTNDFFNKENIIKYGIDKNDLEATVSPLGADEHAKIKDAFHGLVETTNLTSKINKLATDTDKYSIIVNGGIVVKDITFDSDSFKMSYVNDLKFIASASIKMSVNFTYIDYNKTVINGVISNVIYLRVTDDSDIQIGITKLEKNLADDLINSDSTAVWNKATDFGYTQENLYQAFELYNDQKRTRKLSDLINSEGWQTTINNFITEKNYFENLVSSKVKLDTSTQQIQNDKLTSKIEPITHISDPDFYADNMSLRETILQKYEANDDVSFVSGTSKGNQEIYDILNETFKTSYSNFKTSLEENISNYNGTNLDKDNILFGQAVISGLGLNFEELNFVLPINTLTLSYSFSLTGSDFDVAANSTLDKSHLGTAVYKNTEAGIKSFQDNFGISNTVDSTYFSSIATKFDQNGNLNSNGTWRTDKVRIPIVFSGTKNSNPLTVNVYSELGDEINLRLEAGIAKTNSTLSLETNNLSAVRYNLLNDGFQGQFSFKTAATRRIVENEVVSRIQIPAQAGIGNWRFANENNRFKMTNSGYDTKVFVDNQVGASLAFQLDFSLFSVFIGLPEFYVHNSIKYPDDRHKTYTGSFLPLFAKG